jgi:hypothetical protein
VVFAAVLAAIAPLVVLVVGAAPAEASTYRYWTYWWGAGSGGSQTGWRFAAVGPAGHRVGDAWVLGWRFATSTTSGGTAPRSSASFASLCPSLAAPVPGSLRVALVVDYGTSSDAPPGQQPPTTSTVRVECTTVPTGASGVTVLNTVGVSVRSSDGLICALDGYPVGECAPVVPDPTPSASPPHSAAPTASRPAGAAASASSAASHPASASGAARATPSPGAASSPGGSATPSRSSSGPTAGATGSLTPTGAPSAAAGAVTPTGADESLLPAASGSPVAAASTGSAGSAGPWGVLAVAVVVALAVGSVWWRRRSGGTS